MRRSKMLSLLMSLVMAFGVILVDTSAVNAASDWIMQAPEKIYVGDYYGNIGAYNIKTNDIGTAISLKSSSSKILKVTKHTYEDGYVEWGIRPKKPGKVTLTLKFKMPSGKKKTIKQKVVVKKYPKVIKKLTLNGKKINISDNKFEYMGRYFKKNSVKLNMKLKDGWEIQEAHGHVWNFDGKTPVDIKKAKKLVKKGKAIKFPAKYSEFELTITMTNGKDTFDYFVRLSRENG